MKNHALNVLFVIVRVRQNKNGLCPIHCRITYRAKRKVFATGEFVDPDLLDAKCQINKGLNPKDELRNTQLELIRSNLKRAFLSLQLKGQVITLEEILQEYRGEKEEYTEAMVLAYIQEFLRKKEKLIGKDIDLGTWKKYQYAYLQAQGFIKWQFKTKDIPFSELSLQFLKDFEFYLKTELDQGQSTINKCIQRFRSPIREAFATGVLARDSFVLYKARHIKPKITFLSYEELEKLETFEFNNPRLAYIRDHFVFSCYTGLAYNEVMALNGNHLTRDAEGQHWIVMERKKTGGMLQVPLLDKPSELIKKYAIEGNNCFPLISNQKLNVYLKEVAFILGIPKRLTFHMARRTFASTVLMGNNVNLEIISSLLGHSSVAITQKHYSKVSPAHLLKAIKGL